MHIHTLVEVTGELSLGPVYMSEYEDFNSRLAPRIGDSVGDSIQPTWLITSAVTMDENIAYNAHEGMAVTENVAYDTSRAPEVITRPTDQREYESFLLSSKSDSIDTTNENPAYGVTIM